MQLPAFAIDELLDDLAHDQRHQLQQVAAMTELNNRIRRWLGGSKGATPGSSSR
jgi:hypothetical protein